LPVIAPTIITGVAGSGDCSELSRFYETAYAADPAAALHGRWRALGAVGKADHVAELCARAGLAPASVLEVGCGDGALLVELGRRGFASRLEGAEIAPAAVEIARSRAGIAAVELYDGEHLDRGPGSVDLGILSHVLEHVPDPAALLGEVARVCAAVVVEVPLEANWSARRRGRREHAAEIGHLQRLDRAAANAIAESAGLTRLAELEDPLPLAAQRFFAATPWARSAATARWATRSALHRVAPPLARRAFTLHYAYLCARPGVRPPRAAGPAPAP
jgi:SAM-dependent methyltransferase